MTPQHVDTINEALDADEQYWREIASEDNEGTQAAQIARIQVARTEFRAMIERTTIDLDRASPPAEAASD
jgi:hypothetical protein